MPGAHARSKVIQRLLAASGDLPTFLHDLVHTQAVHVAGTEAAAFIIERHGENISLRLVDHIRPDDSTAEVRAQAVRAFQELVQPCVRQGKDGAIEVGSPDGGDSQYCLVTLLSVESQAVAVTAVITRCRDMDRAKQRLASMQLVSGYFELFSLKRQAEHVRALAERHQHVLQFTGAVSNAEGFQSATMALCNEVANRTGATRVAIGWLKGRQIKVKALSHTEKFDKKQELIVQLERVMEECFDQEEPTRYDPDGPCSQNVTRAAAELSRAQGGNIVLASPLRRRDEIVGVITLEFAAKTKVDEQVEGAVAVASELLAPQLYDRYVSDRIIWVKIGHSIRDLAKLAMGPKHMGAKLLILFSVAMILFVTLFRPTYRVRAPFQLVATEKRTLCAPYDGVLLQVNVKPGQTRIPKDTVLAEMATYELRKELLAVQEEINKQKALIQKYRGARDKLGDLNVAESELAKFQAQYDLLQYRIEQAQIKAPFDCVILRGELHDRKGVNLKEGEALFEVARTDADNPKAIAVEAEIQVSERDIQEVQGVFESQRQGKLKRQNDGQLATTSLPSEEFDIVITRIVPQGNAREGENVFSVFATVRNPAEWMQPGMAGDARIEIGRRRLIWWWTHRLVDWLKLKLWI